MMPPSVGNKPTFDLNLLEQGELSAIVSRALGKPVVVADWQVTLLGGLDSSPFAGGVYRVAGQAADEFNQSHGYCLVAKVLRSPEGLTMPDGTFITRDMAEDRGHFGYWRREALAAHADLLASLSAGLRAPRFLGVTEAGTGECWLWQEWVAVDGVWGWAEYEAAAYRLGLWQAAYRELPQHPWLSQNWVANWVHGPLINIFGMVEGMNGYQHPLLTSYFALEERAALRQLWAGRQSYLDRLAALPQTLCHLDAHRGNLNWQDDGLVLFDWAFVGAGALGEELAAFVGATLLLDFVPLADAERLEQVAFAGYLAGLRDAGWAGDEAQIWEAYRCALPIRFAPVSVASMLRTAVQPEFAADWEQKTGKPLADILAHRAGLVRFYLSRVP